MMWDQVMERVLALLQANEHLTAIFADKFQMAGSSQLKIPSVEYTILSDANSEIWVPMLVQFDLWTTKAGDNRVAERIVRSILDQRTSVQWDGVTVIASYTDGAFLSTPDRAGFIGRGLRFRFSALKQQHSQPAN